MHFRLQTSLRAKTLAIILPALIVLVVGLYISIAHGARQRVFHVESDFAADNLSRASSALSNEIDNLQHSAAQVASGDRMSEWTQQKDAKRIAGQFTPGAFEQLRVNFVVVLDTQGQEIFSEGFKLAAMEQGPVPPDLVAYLGPWSPVLAATGGNRDAGGIVLLSAGPALMDRVPLPKRVTRQSSRHAGFWALS